MTEMCVKFEDVSQIKKKMYFEVPWADVEKELDKAYDNLKKTAKIKGFRQGKIPRKILEAYFKDNAENDATANIIAKQYQDVMESKKIHPAGYPQYRSQRSNKRRDVCIQCNGRDRTRV